MRKLTNPYQKLKGYNCFGCSSENQFGLQMTFFENGDEIVSEIDPKAFHSGFENVMHGGIQSTIHDEIASWVVFVKAETAGVTSKLEVKYRKPAFVDQGILKIRAWIVEKNSRLVSIKSQLFNHKDEIASEAETQYFIYPEKIAKEKLHFPGKEAFYAEE